MRFTAAGTYNYDTTTDPTTGGTGGGPSGLVYNTTTVQDQGATIIVQDSGSGAPRACIQYKLQPVGYSSSNVFYLDVSHAKSGTDSSSAQRRNVEAQGIVSNLNSLPAGAHVISLGDFNITSGSTEATYQTMISKFDDVAIPSDSWNDVTSTEAKAISQWLSDSASDVIYRDDIQFVTPSADPSSSSVTQGLQYDKGSMVVFGNGGSQNLYGHDVSSTYNTGVFPDLTSSQRTSILSAEDTTTDHLPVVADYSIVSPNSSVIAGRVFQDNNADGTFNGADTGLSGQTVYLDENNNGVLDSGEPSTITDANGNFSFTGLPTGISGTVTLQNPPSGYVLDNASSDGFTTAGSTSTINLGYFPTAYTGTAGSDNYTLQLDASAHNINVLVGGVLTYSAPKTLMTIADLQPLRRRGLADGQQQQRQPYSSRRSHRHRRRSADSLIVSSPYRQQHRRRQRQPSEPQWLDDQLLRLCPPSRSTLAAATTALRRPLSRATAQR